MKKKFTVKQLFSVTDGRLSTEIGDVYDILNTFTGESLMTHQLPPAMDYLKLVGPDWYARACEQLAEIKEKAGTNDFITLMDYIDKFYSHSYHEVVEMTTSQKINFPEYMIKNSLLTR